VGCDALLSGNACSECGMRVAPQVKQSYAIPKITSSFENVSITQQLPVSASSSSCIMCGTDMLPTATFCGECGHKPVLKKPAATVSPPTAVSPPVVSQPVVTTRVSSCIKCGTELSSTAKFCPECGHKPVASNSDQSGESKKLDNCCLNCKKEIRGYFITALGGKWHEECFVCAECRAVVDTKVTKTFVPKNGYPLCKACTVKLQPATADLPETQTCPICGSKISGKFIIVPEEQRSYHVTCFTCFKCKGSLENGYVKKDGKRLCQGCTN